MEPATIRIIGNGQELEATTSHPAGTVFSGEYDAETNTVFLGSVIGHPKGVAAAGGDPSKTNISGLRIFESLSHEIFWADDSMSLPRGLRDDEIAAIEDGLRTHFDGQTLTRVHKLEDIPR